jgi:iron complex transport system substrate-binding protein
MRIVSICPSNTEILDYLGLTDSIVGVDNYSDWPKKVKMLPQLGPDLSIDMDAVEALKPDLVVASLSVPGMEKNIEELIARGIPHIILNPKNLAEIGEDLLTLGKALNCLEHAERVYENYQNTIQQYKELSKQVNHTPSIYWEWWSKPIFTPAGDNWLTEISELAGGKNLFADFKGDKAVLEWEDVRLRNPDVICLAWVGIRTELVKPQQVLKRPGWSQLPAILQKKMYVLEESLYCRPSPRLLVGLKKLASLLHPSIYPPYVEGEDLW